MKYIYGFLIGLFIFLTSSSSVYAAEEKTVTVPIEKSYKEIIFYFEFSDNQEHTIYLTTPLGDTEQRVFNTDSASISIANAVKGDYEVIIEAEKKIEVKARVECKNNTVGDGNNLTISSSLTGLEVYFVNGDLAVKWQDTGVGDVIVKVTNPKTMRVLAEVEIKDTDCLIALDDTIDQIEVYIVPASSTKIEGAGIGYTLNVVRNIGAVVELPTYTITNQTSIIVPITVSGVTTVYSCTNKVWSEDIVYETAGTYDYEVPILSNTNNVTIYLYDEKGNTNYYTFDITQDLVAPALSFNEQYDGFVTEADVITINGKVEGAVSLNVNDKEVIPDVYGRFSCEVPLDNGSNGITFCAIDEAGNQSIQTFTISRQKIEKESNNGIIIAIVVIIEVAAVALFILKNRNGMSNEGCRSERKEPVKKENLPKEQIKIMFTWAENLKKPKKESIIKVEEEKEAQTKDNERSKRMRRNKFVAETIVTCVQLGVVAVILLFVVRNTIVASGSMEPTLMTKDIVIYNKLAYVFDDVERGDIINFWSKEFGKYFSKRVIGIAGDEIEFHDGYVFINGQKCDESAYIAEEIETNCTKTFTVPEGTVFVLGDNRENSYDSRFFENPYIPVEDIEGKYLGTIPWIFD